MAIRRGLPAPRQSAGFGNSAPAPSQIPQMPAPVQQAAPAPAPVAAPVAVAPPPPPMVNNTAPSPELQRASAQYQSRLGQLQQPRGTDPNQQFLIDKVKERMGTDNTQGLIDREQFRIADQAAARKAGMTNEMGRAGAGAGGRDLNRIDSAAARAQAAASDNIRLGREQQLDALTLGSASIMNAPANMELAREGNLNSFTLNGLPYAQAPGQLAIQQQQLGVGQWNAQANYALSSAQLQQQGNIAAAQIAAQQQDQQAQRQQAYWQSLMRMAGY